MTAPQIGVLMPVRLETRFLRDGSPARWHLRVRIIPDAVSITTHDERVSTTELDAVEAMWRAAGGNGLESPQGHRAWQALASAVGAERAAWLARTFPPVTSADGTVTITRPGDTRDEMRAPKVMGLPPTMELWLARHGAAPSLVAQLTVRVMKVDLDLSDPDGQQPWWASFPEAVRVGLAAEIDLGTAEPDDIDALYVVGIGGGDPGPLLGAQADSGRLGIVPAGAATNSVDGEAAVSLGDAETWRRLVPVGPTAQAGTVAVSKALTGAATVRGIVGGDRDHLPMNKALVGALWPALWGHSLANVWGYGSRADELGVWAAANLVPEGPLPSLRIENQPYGLLPATSLRRWRAAAGDPTIEAQLVPLVRGLVDTWAAAAERQVRKSPVDALHGFVRNAAAPKYAWQYMVPTTVARALSFRFNQPVAAADLDAWWARYASATPRLDPAASPARQLVSVGWNHDIAMALVAPDDLPAGVTLARSLSLLASASIPELLAAGPTDGRRRPAARWGTSLLTELARHSLLATAAAVARRAAGQPRVMVDPPAVELRKATETEAWAARLRPADLTRSGEPAVAVRRNVVSGLKALAKADAADLDRGLRAALETATNRLDPWATAIAWRRLQDLAAAPRTLGVYGWVDAPRPAAAPSDNRFMLAPSPEQAALAAVLRDRALHDADADRWSMQLSSDPIRGALRLADLTREGAHPIESLGQMVEAIAVRPSLIDALRKAFPSTPAFPSGRGHLTTRRVCNGAAVLHAAETRADGLLQLGLTSAQLTALQELAASVDALADLHVAEATYGVVRQRVARVGAASAAAAGQAPPPEFTVVQTPRTGRVVNTVAVVVLPLPAAPTGTRRTPVAIADPAVADYLDARSGSPSGAAWRWTKVDQAGNPAGTVTLSDVGLRPCDTVGLGTASLREVVRHLSGAAGLAPEQHPPGHDVVRSLATALAGVPATASDLGGDASNTASVELAQRYAGLRTAAVTAAENIRNATKPTATAAVQRTAVKRLAQWGISPLASATDDPTIGSLRDRLTRGAEALERRIEQSPESLDGAVMEVLASQISALAAPEGPLPIFAQIPAAAFTGLQAEPATSAKPRLDPDWLETVATVRPALGRLEAVQLAQRVLPGGQPLRAWSNRVGDPWQTVAPQAPETEVVRSSRLVAAFGTPDVLPNKPVGTTAGAVAVAVIDRFAETIPDAEHQNSVAFPHDLPPARAPQAVVLAVPPAVDQGLTPDVLVDIVAEVRALARVRMVDATQLGPAASALHLSAMPASGPAGLRLGADQ